MTNRLELSVVERTTFADGESFATAGAYERIAGRAHFAVDPAAKAQAGIVDIDKAARDARGLVHFTADFLLLKPVDMKNGNQRLLFDWANRGNKRCLQFFNDAPGSNDPRSLAHAGNGFLMRRGYTIAWLAWQGDLLPGDGRQILDLPVATDNGRPITGPVRVEFIADQPGVTVYPLSGRVSTRSHPTVSRDTAKASLTRRRYPGDARIPVPVHGLAVCPHRRWRRSRQSGRRASRRGVGHAYLHPGRLRDRLDLRAGLRGQGPARAGAGACRRARFSSAS